MARLSVAVLGTPEVRHGREALVFPTRKSLAILVYLLVEGGTHRRDKLATLFWPDSDEDAGRATLRSTLARLREGLGESTDGSHLIIERDAVGFNFASDFELDARSLDAASGLARTLSGPERPSDEARRTAIVRLQQGADAWRGEFLEAFSLRDAPDFDDWAGLQREIWRQRAEAVLDRLSLLQAEAGASAGAIATINRWLRLNPLDERAHRRLIQVHAAAGDRAAALRAYEACRAVLEKELGVRPEPETEAVAERIRTAPSQPREARRRGTSPPPHALLEGPLVGRADEFTKLVELFHTCRRGRPQAVTLVGEAGIGKTRLAAEFLGWAAAHGADVLQARAFETGAHLPYQPLIDAARPRVERENAPEALLSDTWLVELSRLLPELRDRYPDLPVPVGDVAAARTRLFEALARLGRALADRAPLVLFIDDVQWADAASLEVLRYAARRWTQDGVTVLLLFGLRAEALTTAELGEWLVGLHRDVAGTDLDLGPLTFEDTLALLGSTPASPPAAEIEDFARWLFAETSGQPFFLVETLRALLEQGALAPRRREDGNWAIDVVRGPNQGERQAFLPPSVRQIIQARLARLTSTGRDLLAAASILGQGFSFEMLCRVGHLTEDDALPALDEVLRSHLLREARDGVGGSGEGRYVFGHDKIRDVVYAGAGGARRRVFHRRALDGLEEAAAPAAELARQALAAGLDEPALRYSIAAGDEAMRLLAARDAATHYERAIALAERLGRGDLVAESHARRGHAFVSIAMWVEARRELEAALAGLGPDLRDRRAEVLVDLIEACWWLLDIPAMRRHATEALGLADRLGRGDIETKAAAWLASAEGSAGNLRACVEQNRRVIDRAYALGIMPPAVAGHFESVNLYWLGRVSEAVRSASETVDQAREEKDIPWLLLSLPHLAAALAGSGRYAEAASAFEEARRLSRDYGIENLRARAIAWSTGFHLDLFDLAGAEALALEARESALAVNFVPSAVSAGIDLLLTYARLHDVGRTEQLIDEVATAAERASGFHGWQWMLRLAEARAEIALARGGWEEARRWADDVIAQSRARGRVKYHVVGLTTHAQALIGLGRTKEAIADLTTAVALARPVGDPALLLRALAALAAVSGDDTIAAEGRAVIKRILEELPDAEMRRRVGTAEPFSVLTRRM